MQVADRAEREPVRLIGLQAEAELARAAGPAEVVPIA